MVYKLASVHNQPELYVLAANNLFLTCYWHVDYWKIVGENADYVHGTKTGTGCKAIFVDSETKVINDAKQRGGRVLSSC